MDAWNEKHELKMVFKIREGSQDFQIKAFQFNNNCIFAG
jgi:hypothetical protein